MKWRSSAHASDSTRGGVGTGRARRYLENSQILLLKSSDRTPIIQNMDWNKNGKCSHCQRKGLHMRNFGKDRRNIRGVVAGEKLLSPFFDDIVLSVRDGQEHYQKIPLELMLPFRRRTKASMLNDAIVQSARPRLEGRGIKVDD